LKILYFGGQKSGKSGLAEKRTLLLSQLRGKKAVFVATYDDSFEDSDMQKRIENHRVERGDSFITVEETLHLSDIVAKSDETYLIECVSMWILNTMGWGLEKVLNQIETIGKSRADIVFVLNSVGSGVIPMDGVSREYIDRIGLVGQKLARFCDEVYEVKFGIEVRIK
jgi:adenosylcobinamide kinase/adenosylcobinamide-phosphate guanylyltransferase